MIFQVQTKNVRLKKIFGNRTVLMSWKAKPWNSWKANRGTSENGIFWINSNACFTDKLRPHLFKTRIFSEAINRSAKRFNLFFDKVVIKILNWLQYGNVFGVFQIFFSLFLHQYLTFDVIPNSIESTIDVYLNKSLLLSTFFFTLCVYWLRRKTFIMWIWLVQIY